MWRNYFKTAWRNLAKNKAHSFINIAGLSIGMCVAMLIGFWIHDEVSYDKNFGNYNRIARVFQNVTNNGEVQTWTSMPWPLAEELRKNYGADFKHVVMATNVGTRMLSFDNKKLNKEGGFFESAAPEMFTLEMLHGNWNALKDPSSIILSASTAKAYFGNENPMNKMMKIDNNLDVKVTGVYKDLPHNSSLSELAFIAPWDLFYNIPDGVKTMTDPWRPNAFAVYAQLNDNADIKKASLRIKDAKMKKVNPQLQKKKPELFLHPMSEWHLRSEFKDGVNIGGRIQYVWMFGIIGVFVLLLACINFMNLSTAKSEKRAKEVGIRKAVGSLRGQLIKQFFSESLLIVVFAFAFSLILVQLILPFFNEVADKKMVMPWGNPMFWMLGVLFSIITGLVAGSYPALYLSSFKPVKVLKGVFKAGPAAAIPRKVLLVVQFTVSVVLIIGTIVVYQQIQYAKNRPLGYNRERLINIYMANSAIHDHFEAVKSELVKAGAIEAIAEAGSPPTGSFSSTSGLDWKGKDPNLSIDFSNTDVSYDFGKTVEWELKEGRDFSREFATDSSAMILNEAAARFMGLQKPLGETVNWWGRPFQVIAVAKDIVSNSPYTEVRPTVYTLNSGASNSFILKLNAKTSTGAALKSIESVFKKFNPEQPFEYQFIDDEFARKFGDEERVGKLAGFFAILAIAICCLGLFGLASFMAEQRTREIGLRKVLGASILNVWHLLSKEFVKLVIISFLIAIPLAYYFMHNWLQNYQYRTDLSWWIFAAAGTGALLITILVVSFQAIKAALANPVKSLRTE